MAEHATTAEQGKKPGTPADAAAGAGAAPDKAGAPEQAAAETPALSAGTVSLLGLIDKLNSLLEKSDLVELEVRAGESTIILRKPAALPPAPAASGGATPAAASDPGGAGSRAEPAVPVSAARTVRAPLTGIFYAASSPSATPYVTVGQQVAVGQIIGLIEAMKLFNEIKSDQSGRVVRVIAESGKLVKAKSPLIEVEP